MGLLISHLLDYLSAHFRTEFCYSAERPWLELIWLMVDGRLSEGIDLIAVGSMSEVAHELDRALPRAVMRIHGRLEWDPVISEVPEHLGAVLRSLRPWPRQQGFRHSVSRGQLTLGAVVESSESSAERWSNVWIWLESDDVVLSIGKRWRQEVRYHR